MYLNHTIENLFRAYRGTYKLEIILIFHSESKTPPHWISNKEEFYLWKGVE